MSLTQHEHELMDALSDVYHRFCAITPEGETRDQDLREVVFHIHALQRMVMAQSAAEQYPDRYRAMGGTVA